MAAAESRETARPTGGRSPSLWALTKVLFYKRLILLVRYPVNTAAQFVMLFLFFAVVFVGGQSVAGAALTDTLGGIIVGFFLFTLAVSSYSGVAWNVIREAQWGTLERLYMSPHGFGVVMAITTVVNFLVSLLLSGILLVAMMAVTGRWLAVDPLTVVPLIALTLMPVVGIGFLFAGLALIFKRVENLFRLVQFVFIGLIAAPTGSVEWLKLLPVTHGSYLLRVAMEDGIRLWAFPAQELALLVATATVYLLAGYYCFHRASVRARKLGLLGHY